MRQRSSHGRYKEMNENEINQKISGTAVSEEIPEIKNAAPTDEVAETHAEIDYEELLNSDIEELKNSFAELGAGFSVTDLKNPIRYGALRDMGLSPAEAYLATGGRVRTRDNRAHLTVSVPGTAIKKHLDIPRTELKIAKEIFSDMSEAELHRLYRKVSG